MNWRTSFAFVGLSLLTGTPLEGLDIDDFAARSAAVAAITSRSTGACLKTRRKEQLEEDLFDLRREKMVDGKLNETYFVYEVVDIGCYTVENSSLIIHTIDHPQTRGYVAVDKVSGKTYGLWPYDDARREFNRLIRDLGVAVDGDSDAIRVAALFREIALGAFEGNQLYDRFQLRQLAEESFRDAYGQADWARRFGHWWRRFDSTSSKRRAGRCRKGGSSQASRSRALNSPFHAAGSRDEHRYCSGGFGSRTMGKSQIFPHRFFFDSRSV